MQTHVKHLSAPKDTVGDPPYIGDQAQFCAINGLVDVQLQAFKSGNDVSVQCSFPLLGWPTLSINLSNTNPTGSINMPDFSIGTGGNTINYTNLKINLQANYNGTSPTSVYAALQLDVSVGWPYEPRGTVGANYVLGF